MHEAPRSDRTVAVVPALMILVIIATFSAIHWRLDPNGTIDFWPACGVLFAGLVLLPKRRWIWAVPLLAVANQAGLMLGGRSAGISAAFTVITVCMAMGAAAFLWRNQPYRVLLRNQRHLLDFATAVIAAAIPGALLSALAASQLLDVPFSHAYRLFAWTYAAWMLILAATALAWSQPSSRPLPRLELAIQLPVLLVLLGAIVSPLASLTPAFLLFPLMTWAAMRLGLRVVTSELVAIAIVFTAALTVRGGALSGQSSATLDPRMTAIVVQGFLAVFALLMLSLTVSVEQASRLKHRLSGSSALFRNNFADSLLAMLVLQDKFGTYSVYDANRTAAELLGLPTEALVGSDLETLITTDLPIPELATLVAGSSWRTTGTLVSDQRRRVRLSLVRLANDSDLLTAQLLDVTAESEATEGMLSQQRLSEITMQTTPAITVITTIDGKIVQASLTASKLTGLSRSQLVGKNFSDLAHNPHESEEVRKLFRPETQLPESIETQVDASDGAGRRVFWHCRTVSDDLGDPEFLVFNGMDVTAERNATALMRYLLSAAIGTAMIGLDVKGRVTLFNTGASTLLQISSAEATEREFTSFFDEAWFRGWAAERGLPPTFDSLVLELTADQGSQDLQWRTHDDRQLWVSMSLNDVRDDHNRLVGYLCVAHDVTDVRRGEQLLIAALDKQRHVVDQLRELDSAKDEFVSTVSHELRTPTASIVGYAEMLTSGDFGEVAGVQLRPLEAITRNADRLIHLANNLLTLNGLSGGQLTWTPAEVDVRDVAIAAESTVAALAKGRELEIVFDLPDQPALVRGDRQQLDRVLDNLLSNAVKFTPEGGRITCQVLREGGEVIVVVSDTGVGIPLDEQDRVGERFWRSSTAQVMQIQGTGLGLAIVRAIVKTHSGIVDFVSEPGEGTTVTVTLPALKKTRTSHAGDQPEG